MLKQIIFMKILGLPMIAWGGMFTFAIFILAAYVGWQNSKGVNKPPLITFKAHKLLAATALLLALLHGILGLLAFIG